MLDLLPEAVFVIRGDLALLGGNRAARGLLREGDGLRLAQERLVASTPEATAELRRCAASLARGEVCRLRVPRPGRAPLALRVETHPQQAGAVVFATDPEPEAGTTAAELAARYGFTRTECDVARRLAAGERVAGIANELGITLHTVRGHLKHVYAKAGVHRQAELVARLLSEA